MAIQEQPTDPTRGLFRVPLWFGTAAVGFLSLFISQLADLQPNWSILGALALVPLAFAFKEIKNLLALNAGTRSERQGIALAILGAALVAVPLVYFSWQFGPTAAMRLVDTYLPPILVPITAALASVAFYVERTSKMRVYVGNKGWVFLSREQPSNPTAESDARKSGARGSP